jgi:hypothetical protein
MTVQVFIDQELKKKSAVLWFTKYRQSLDHDVETPQRRKVF